MKTPLFMDRVLIFLFPSIKSSIFMDRKRQPKAVLSRRRELNYVKAVRYIGIYLCEFSNIIVLLRFQNPYLISRYRKQFLHLY